MKKIIRTFDEIPLQEIKKPKVGVVGEILVKYSPTANNDIVRLLEEEGAEAVVPDIVGFMNYSLYNQIWKYENMGMSKQSKRQYPQANIAAVDYDPGVSLVNQLNRIRLMMATANKLLKEENVKR